VRAALVRAHAAIVGATGAPEEHDAVRLRQPLAAHAQQLPSRAARPLAGDALKRAHHRPGVVPRPAAVIGMGTGRRDRTSSQARERDQQTTD